MEQSIRKERSLGAGWTRLPPPRKGWCSPCRLGLAAPKATKRGKPAANPKIQPYSLDVSPLLSLKAGSGKCLFHKPGSLLMPGNPEPHSCSASHHVSVIPGPQTNEDNSPDTGGWGKMTPAPLAEEISQLSPLSTKTSLLMGRGEPLPGSTLGYPKSLAGAT